MGKVCVLLLLVLGELVGFSAVDVFPDKVGTCDGDHLQCADGLCVHRSWVCDGMKDCHTGEDEKGCSHMECDRRFFECSNGNCIHPKFKCNNINDCGDFSDEKGCGNVTNTPTSCSKEEFLCKDRPTCIPIDDVCNGFADCYDESDERDCEVSCRPDQFLCINSSYCISKQHVCDNQTDCLDDSDEVGCGGHVYQCRDHTDGFLCDDHSDCIKARSVCDGHQDCQDGSDEKGDCSVECAKQQCDFCLPSPSGVSCVCGQGYQLSPKDNRTCHDIDECNSSDSARVCSQSCQNFPGSFYCGCAHGYELSVDGRTCKAKGPEAVLIYATVSEIRTFSMRKHVYDVLLEDLDGVTGLAVDARGSKIFWSERGFDGVPGVYYIDPDSPASSKTTVTSFGLSQPHGLAFDFEEKNLYIADPGIPAILACTLHGVCISLFNSSTVTQPIDLALNVDAGMLYWTDTDVDSLSGVILSGGMDGLSSNVLVSGNLGSPVSLVVDTPTQRLYWIDAFYSVLECVSLEGIRCPTVVGHNIGSPSMLAVFEDEVIWANRAHHNIMAANKFTGHRVRPVIGDVPQPTALAVFHPSLEVLGEMNRCFSKMCSHMCLKGPDRSAICACPPGHTLDSWETTCLSDNSGSAFLIAAHRDGIISLSLDTAGAMHVNSLTSATNNAFAMAYLANSHEILYSDSTDSLRVSLNKLVDLDSDPRSVPVLRDLRMVESLAVDESASVVYWVDGRKNTIEVASMDGKWQNTLQVDGMRQPHAVAVDPTAGHLYFSDIERPSTIRRCFQDGSKCSTFVSERLHRPNVILVYNGRVYWSDFRTGDISSVDMEGKQRTRHVVCQGSPLSIAVHLTTLFWTELDNENIFFVDISKAGKENQVNTHKAQLTGLTIATPQEPLRTQCSVNNGGCDHLCLPTAEDAATCLCARDFHLKDELGSCEKINSLECSEYLCHDRSACVEERKVCNLHLDCLDGSDEMNCPPIAKGVVTCPGELFLCADGPCVPRSFVCDGDLDCRDGSDESSSVCPDKICSSQEHACGDGKTCLAPSYRCNGIPDCEDKSDEANCPPKSCETHEFSCREGCIVGWWRCDGDEDCDGGEDEKDCPPATCAGSEMTCQDGSCVDRDDVCDGTDNCEGGDDEQDCPTPEPKRCDQDDFLCFDGDCIHHTAVCDGFFDCASHEDEMLQYCPTPAPCKALEFACAAGECIDRSRVCDGVAHCKNKADESPEQCPPPTPEPTVVEIPMCPGGFQCEMGQCVRSHQVCDNITHCMDGSDENSCEVTCAKFNPCPQACVDSPRGPTCACFPGYSLKDKVICEDTDECQEKNGGCSQECVNQKGGYQCVCEPGFRQVADVRGCKAMGPRPTLLVGTPTGIRTMTSDGSAEYATIPTKAWPLRLDGNAHTGEVFWVQYQGSHSSNMTLYKWTGKESLTLEQNLPNVWGVALDWITGNVYMTQESFGAGAVTVYDGSAHSAILTHVADRKLGDIALHPHSGRMFWLSTAMGSSRLDSAWMDGRARKTILSSMGRRPVALCVDHVVGRVYWLDLSAEKVETCKIDGTDRYTVSASTLATMVSMDVFEGMAYLADQKRHTIARLTMYRQNLALSALHTVSHPGPLKVLHKLKQPAGINPCANISCMFLCVLTPYGSRCICRDGFVDSSNERCEGPRQTTVRPSRTGNMLPTLSTSKDRKGMNVLCSPPCQNGGTCMVDSNMLQSCSCPPSFLGKFCQTDTERQQKKEQAEDASVAWIAGVVVAIIVVVLLVLLGVWYFKFKRGRRSLMGSIKFKNPHMVKGTVERQDLVPEISFGNPGFQDEEEESSSDQDWWRRLLSRSKISVGSTLMGKEGSGGMDGGMRSDPQLLGTSDKAPLLR